MVKVSVVVPVYNTEKYLRDCLDSIISQTLEEIEIICVNDGSTDSSAEILQEYSQKDSRIIVINKENGGPSAARNCGMQNANGVYIYFIDSDDLLEEFALKELYEMAEQDDIDIVYFCADNFYENYELEKENSKFNKYNHRKQIQGVITGEDLMRTYLNNEEFRVCVPYQFFKKSFLIGTGITFLEGILHEDELFSPKVLSMARRVRVSDNVYYKRRVRQNSITTKPVSHKNFEGCFTGAVDLLFYAETVKDNEIIYEFLMKSTKDLFDKARNIYTSLNTVERNVVFHEMPEKCVLLFNQIKALGGQDLTRTITYKIGKAFTYIPCLIRNHIKRILR